MRTFDFAPFHRSTIGFDRLFDTLDSGPRPDWPPYNIEKAGENEYRITMALAGYRADEIEVIQNGTELSVAGRKQPETENRQFLHKGLALGDFHQTFRLADHMKVVGAQFNNGLLSVELVREIPEQLKPRRIAIGQPDKGVQTVARPDAEPSRRAA